MGVFDDKRYNELDWVSQAVQPIETPLAAVLESIPERYEITYNDLAGHDRLSLSKEYVLGRFLNGQRYSWKETDALLQCFEFQTNDEEIILNMEDRTLTGKIYFVKVKHTLDEDALKKLLGQEGVDALNRASWYNADLKRINEMLELVEKTEDALRSRSTRQKREKLCQRLREIFANNEWNVKGAELADKIGIWIKSYIETGDLQALSNITRLKVMTYKGAPIYSVEEA